MVVPQPPYIVPRGRRAIASTTSFKMLRSPPTECLVGGALSLVLRISRCAGVAPLNFTAADAGWHIVVSPPLDVFQRVFMTALNLVALAALILDFQEDPSKSIRLGESAVTTFVWIADLALVLAIASLAVYRGSARMEKLIRLLRDLQKINADLNNTGCQKMEKIGVIAVTSILLSTLMVQFADAYIWFQYSIDKGYNWSIVIMYSSYYIGNYLGLLALLQWGFVTLAVHNAAAAVNQHLLRLHHVKLKTGGTAMLEVNLSPPKPVVDCFTERDYDITPSGSDFAAYPLQVQSMVRRLASSYGHIGELMRQMNETNGTIIMAILMASFLHLVLNPYYTFLVLNAGDSVLEAVVVPLCGSFLQIAVLLVTVEPCHWTQEQRETTKFLLSRVTVRLAPKSTLLARELKQFAKQTVLSNIKFSALGVLTLGRPLVASMFGGVATYLVILMQFHALTNH
ncbi:gustatory receptor for sugar taste 43a-like [Cydia strobilella]|uniref:gustatory receptor for sugar taste 43a-like n=1 Tax=Cydia strobilella TaxID=1100964 RepID=UPI003003BB31